MRRFTITCSCRRTVRTAIAAVTNLNRNYSILDELINDTGNNTTAATAGTASATLSRVYSAAATAAATDDEELDVLNINRNSPRHSLIYMVSKDNGYFIMKIAKIRLYISPLSGNCRNLRDRIISRLFRLNYFRSLNLELNSRCKTSIVLSLSYRISNSIRANFSWEFSHRSCNRTELSDARC